MNNSRFNSSAVAAIFAAFFCFAFVVSAYAQGRYANVYSRSDVSGFISNLENSSDEFRRDFDREMDNSSLNGTDAERRFNNTVRDFENSVDRLRRNFDSGNNWWNSRSQVQTMMSNARPVNVMMNTLQFRRRIERQWNNLRRDINKLADTYDLADLSGGGGNWGGGGSGNAPSWAVGTFYGQNPQYGGTITLTIERNGSVRSSYNGATSYGTMNGSSIYMEGVTARVTQINNGIRARGDNGNTVNYYRNNSGDGGPGWGGGSGNAPSWAVGTYRATDPKTGLRISLVVNRNGSVTSSAGGATSYGTMNGSQIYMEGVTVNVSQTRNGIRTTRVDNGEVVNYRRN